MRKILGMALVAMAAAGVVAVFAGNGEKSSSCSSAEKCGKAAQAESACATKCGKAAEAKCCKAAEMATEAEQQVQL